MKYWLKSIAKVVIVGIIIYIIIVLVNETRSLNLDNIFLFVAALLVGCSLEDACRFTSMFRKNMGTGSKKALIILVSIACLIFVIYSIYCLIINRSMAWTGYIIALVLVVTTYIIFRYKYREMSKTNLD